MKNKERFKYEWDLLKKGLIYCGRKALDLAALIVAIFGSFILLRYLALRFEYDAYLSNKVSMVIALILALIIYKMFFPWFRKSVVRIFTEKEVKE
jgi:hypothetical protein